eukprot:scaffold248522_cov79-Cyclotella_meneghiniana.AAC.1
MRGAEECGGQCMEVDTIRLRKAHRREADNSLRWSGIWDQVFFRIGGNGILSRTLECFQCAEYAIDGCLER